MAVTITKKFHNGTEYKDIAKVVFTSPNFDSPYTAGTRSHMPPGGEYIGTWYEAVDYMYREFDNQDYANFPTEMESFFGKLSVSGVLDFENDTSALLWHKYGADFDVVGAGINVVYKDKNTYAIIDTCTPGTISGSGEVKYTADVTFSSVVGSGIINEWITSTVTSNITDAAVTGTSIGDTNPVQACNLSVVVFGTSDESNPSILSGTVSGALTGIMYGSGTVTGDVTGSVQGLLTNTLGMSSTVSGTVSGTLTGPEHGIVSGTVSGTLTGAISGPDEYLCFQYVTATPVDADSTEPRIRRHHGGNSVIFSVTFGEAYDCRLTAWDDATHSTTDNKVLAEEHYKVDAVAYRSNVPASAHAPVFLTEGCLVYPQVYDLALKGNTSYYGDFDLIYAIADGEYGEYLVFAPRLVNMDSSFTAGSYDFVTTLHYQYT